MDEVSGLCAGCFRTIGEIADWSRISDAARLEILSAVALRRGMKASASEKAPHG